MIVCIDETTRLRAQALLPQMRVRVPGADLAHACSAAVRVGLRVIARTMPGEAPSGEGLSLSLDPIDAQRAEELAAQHGAPVDRVVGLAVREGIAVLSGEAPPGTGRFRVGGTPLGAAPAEPPQTFRLDVSKLDVGALG